MSTKTKPAEWAVQAAESLRRACLLLVPCNQGAVNMVASIIAKHAPARGVLDEVRDIVKEEVCDNDGRGCPVIDQLKAMLTESAPSQPAQTESDAIAALRVLVKMYVANLGNPQSEFITCITPSHSSDMTPQERSKDKTWKAWDGARSVLAGHDKK